MSFKTELSVLKAKQTLVTSNIDNLLEVNEKHRAEINFREGSIHENELQIHLEKISLRFLEKSIKDYYKQPEHRG